MRASFLLMIVTLVLLGCFGSATETEDEGAGLDSALYISRSELALTNELETASGKMWVVYQTPMLDSSLVNIIVEARGFSSDSLTFDFGEVDPVVELRLEDLNRDGFQEIYIVTRSIDPLGAGSILGLNSVGDSTISMITYEGPTPYNSKEGEPYDRYAGQDVFAFRNSALTNNIHVETLPGSTARTRTIAYELVSRENSMLLKPVKEKEKD